MKSKAADIPLLLYDMETCPSAEAEGQGRAAVCAFTTTRQGGVSRGSYASLNINPYCGDEPEAVGQNRRLLAARLGIDPERIVLPHQVHQARCLCIDNSFMLLSLEERNLRLEGYDALITNVPGVCIGVSTADCTPVLLYDPVHKAAAAVHAGWRGTVRRIVEHAVSEMTRHYGTSPSQLTAAIGPCISLANFEVGDEVYEAFRAEGFPMERISKRMDKWHIDLPECNKLQLLGAGLQETNIRVSGICTFGDYENCFSARRLGTNSGRLFSGIIIRQ